VRNKNRRKGVGCSTLGPQIGVGSLGPPPSIPLQFWGRLLEGLLLFAGVELQLWSSTFPRIPHRFLVEMPVATGHSNVSMSENRLKIEDVSTVLDPSTRE